MPTPGQPPRPTDAELVQRVRSALSADEQRAAFTSIYDRYLDEVSWLCGRALREWDSALDAVQDTFAAAYDELARKRTVVSNMRGWILRIAARSCYRYMRGGSPGSGHRHGLDMLLADDDAVASIADAEVDLEEVVVKAALRADAERLVAVVAATLTERQLNVYELSFRENLRGQALGQRLGVNAAQASRLTSETALRMKEGIGALILARVGREHCAALAAILDQAAWKGDNFNVGLRDRIIRHFGTCPTCDHCSKCAGKQEELGKELVPVLLPILFAGVLRERLEVAISNTSTADLRPPRGPGSGLQPLPVAAKWQARGNRGADDERSSSAAVMAAGTRRTGRSRWAAPLAAAAAIALVIGGIFSIPKLLGTPKAHTAISSASPSQAADLAGGAPRVWQLTPWTRPNGLPPAGSSQWEFIGSCSESSSCSYSLRVVKSILGPDILYSPIVGSAHKTLQLNAIRGGYKGTNTFVVGCGKVAPIRPETLRDTVNIRTISSVTSHGILRATKLAIRWNQAIIHISPSARAIGCTKKSYTFTATATPRK